MGFHISDFYIFQLSALLHQPDEKLDCPVDALKADALVVSMYCRPLFAGQIHCGEAVDAVG